MKKLSTILIALLLLLSAEGQILRYSNYTAPSGGEGGTEYCDEYQAVYDAMTNKPSATNAGYQNTMVDSLVITGFWAKIDVLYIFANNTLSNSLINWKNPGTYNATLGGSGQTFIEYEGITDNGGWIESTYNPTIHASSYTLNSASIGAYWRLSNTTSVYNGIAIDDYTNLTGIRPVGYGLAIGTVNSDRASYNITTSSQNWQGQFVVSRTSSSAVSFYKNETTLVSGTDNSTSIPNSILSMNGESGNQISIAFVGGGLTTSEVQTLMHIFNSYMSKINKNVY